MSIKMCFFSLVIKFWWTDSILNFIRCEQTFGTKNSSVNNTIRTHCTSRRLDQWHCFINLGVGGWLQWNHQRLKSCNWPLMGRPFGCNFFYRINVLGCQFELVPIFVFQLKLYLYLRRTSRLTTYYSVYASINSVRHNFEKKLNTRCVRFT